MEAELRNADLLEGLNEARVCRLLAIAKSVRLHEGEYLFLLGDHADRLFVVLRGVVDICFPLALGGDVKDVAVESKEAGSTLGWSALVRPHRFTMSARAKEPSEVAAFPRQALLSAFDDDPDLAYVFTRRVAEVVGRRLLNVEALWARELQRALTGGLGPAAGLPAASAGT